MESQWRRPKEAHGDVRLVAGWRESVDWAEVLEHGQWGEIGIMTSPPASRSRP